jgi:hypothetical protein
MLTIFWLENLKRGGNSEELGLEDSIRRNPSEVMDWIHLA